jgi:F-box interacting protein
MDKTNNSSRDLSTDTLVEILVRLPPNSRRRLRLVCHRWRKLIDQRTGTDMQRRTKIIAVAKGPTMSVVDLLKPGSPRLPLWRTNSYTAQDNSTMSIIGTCNGLVCLCDDLIHGGAIIVANPSTDETLYLPPLPTSRAPVDLDSNRKRSWHQTYGFGYHHGTGRYKVVHAPCHFDTIWQPRDIVHVFTLGEASWREVHAETNARCSLGCSSIINVDDMIYWLTEEAGKIMSFDLKHERVTHTNPLAVPAMSSTYHLAKLHGRLGIAISDDDYVSLWVLEGERWSHRYILELRQQEKWMMKRELLVPHLVPGDYFLTLTRESWSGFFILYRHMMSETSRLQQDGVVQIGHKDQGEEVACSPRCIYQIFSYVETNEPLNVYKTVLDHNKRWS